MRSMLTLVVFAWNGLMPVVAFADDPSGPILLGGLTTEGPVEIQAVEIESPWPTASALELEVNTCHRGAQCLSFKEALGLALRQDPAYRGARGKLVAGIVVTSVSGAAAVALGFLALTAHAADEAFGGWGDGDGDYDHDESTAARNLGIASLSSLVVCLAVGLPVLVSGAREIRQIRSRVRQQLLSGSGIGLSLGSQHAGLTMRWQF